MQHREFLTVADVATELGITPSGVYKLIERDHLKAIRRSERGVRVSAIALDAYRRRINGEHVEIQRPAPVTRSFDELVASFERNTEHSIQAWLDAWKRDALEDSPQNMRRTMAALALANWDHAPDAQRAAVRELV